MNVSPGGCEHEPEPVERHNLLDTMPWITDEFAHGSLITMFQSPCSLVVARHSGIAGIAQHEKDVVTPVGELGSELARQPRLSMTCSGMRVSGRYRQIIEHDPQPVRPV